MEGIIIFVGIAVIWFVLKRLMSATANTVTGKGTFKELPSNAKGGVRVSFSPEEALENVREMLGKTLVTKQTGPTGKQVNRLYIEDGAEIDRELYLSILVDRETGKISFVASTEGGMDIEAVAENTPEKNPHHRY